MDWLKSIQEGKSKEIAKRVFLEYTTQERISRDLYPNRKKLSKGNKKTIKIKKNGTVKTIKEKTTHYVEPIVNRNFKIWKENKFISKSEPLYFKDKLGRDQTARWNIMNLNPLFKYCSEIKNIKFSKEEREYLESFLIPMRQKILSDYPEEDIINAILKFYSSNFPLKYFLAIRENRDLPKRYLKERIKAMTLNDPNHPLKKQREKVDRFLNKKFGKSKKEGKWDEIKVWAKGSEENELFSYYYNQLEISPELVESTDRKILKALGLYPYIKEI